MGDINWGRYQKCPVCSAALGVQCRSMTGVVAGVGHVETLTEKPHHGRKLRAGGGRG